MHEKEGLGPLPSEEKLDLGRKILKDEVWSERERKVLGGEERLREMNLNYANPIYKSSVILDRSRGVEL